MIRSVLLGLVFAQTAASAVVTPASIGTWTMERNKAGKADGVITSAHVEGDGLRIDYGCNGGHGARTMLIITSRNYLGGVEGAAFRPAVFRADGGHPISVKVRYDDNTVMVRYNDALRPVRAALVGSRFLAVRLMTQVGDPIDASVDVTGAANALAFVDKACEAMPAARP